MSIFFSFSCSILDIYWKILFKNGDISLCFCTLSVLQTAFFSGFLCLIWVHSMVVKQVFSLWLTVGYFPVSIKHLYIYILQISIGERKKQRAIGKKSYGFKQRRQEIGERHSWSASLSHFKGNIFSSKSAQSHLLDNNSCTTFLLRSFHNTIDLRLGTKL